MADEFQDPPNGLEQSAYLMTAKASLMEKKANAARQIFPLGHMLLQMRNAAEEISSSREEGVRRGCSRWMLLVVAECQTMEQRCCPEVLVG